MTIPGEELIDRENAFLLYATFCGDVERTAHALNVSAVIILKMADEEGWANKLGPIIALKKSTRPGDVERAINRALNFVQAHRMRLFVARVIHSLTGLTESQFNDYIYPETTAKDGSKTTKISTRAIADLASAMEKCQSLTYLALTDTVADRTKRKEDSDPESSSGDMHAQIAASLAAIRSSSTPRAQLFDAQLKAGQEIIVLKPSSPNDNDDH